MPFFLEEGEVSFFGSPKGWGAKLRKSEGPKGGGPKGGGRRVWGLQAAGARAK